MRRTRLRICFQTLLLAAQQLVEFPNELFELGKVLLFRDSFTEDRHALSFVRCHRFTPPRNYRPENR